MLERVARSLNRRRTFVALLALIAFGEILVSNKALAIDCTNVSGATVTITASCSELDISGDGSNVTINSGVTIDNGKEAVGTKKSTNTTITNNGIISATKNFGLRNGSGGDITNLINNESISAGKDSGLRNDIGSTITTLTNAGTISAVRNYGIQHRGTIGTITNSGTISAGAAYGLHLFDSSTTITSLTNSGTISAGTHDGLRNKGKIDTITNSGTISAGTKYGLFNDGTITTLTNTNTGKISAGTDFAIANTGSIGTFVNFGSITPTGNTGISNQGSITTFNNLQGKSSNPVTFIKSLPTNYNVIVNDIEDYGQIVFSAFSGTTNFGVDSSSKLANDTTYSSVLSGLSSSDIASGFSGRIASSNACNDVSGTTITISANCADLDISGTNSNVTINSGVTISGEGDKNWTLINRGTLWDLVVSDDDDVVNTGTGTFITNLGTISAEDDNGLLNETSASITTLFNSGTITAADDFGLYNAGTITTLTNTGTIFALGNNIGIYNSGTITTINNSQGATGSALTYDGKLPTNYNVIVNSTSDYGQIVFSGVSGKINFGVDSSSALTGDTTYSSVLSGLSSSDIANGFSGSLVSGATRHNWTLDNISGNLWDLNIASKDITDDTNLSVNNSVKPNVLMGINTLNSVTEANFANMNTYDCNFFGKNDGCFSLGGRYTAITNPKTQVYSGVLKGGFRLSDTLRVGGFFHHNFIQKTPKSFKLSDKTPLVGAIFVWNENGDKRGYQLKLANAFQQKNAALTREIVGVSEEGRGRTVIEAQSYVAELQYIFQLSDKTIYQPYLAVRRALIKQDAYTETGLSSPLSFNEIEDKSTTVLMGLKFKRHFSKDLLLRAALGVEYDISHTVDRLEPTGISGLTTVNLNEGFNETRPVVSIGFEYNLKPNHRLAGTAQYQELPYQSKTESNAYIYYMMAF